MTPKTSDATVLVLLALQAFAGGVVAIGPAALGLPVLAAAWAALFMLVNTILINQLKAIGAQRPGESPLQQPPVLKDEPARETRP